jgi:CRISPR system Cascade subunit CasD
MSVLLMRLAGPMQSWGTQSRFSVRDTGLEPSKSGVVGLLCAALGRPRSAAVDDLAALRMAVRVDREGSMARDFHTAQDVLRSDGSGLAETVISSRYYLADFDFLVALEGERPFLEQLDKALRQPVWPLFLGRKSFVPGLPVDWPVPPGGVVDSDLMTVVRSTAWHRHSCSEDEPSLRCVSDVHFDSARFHEPRQDVPVSFEKRIFAVRQVWIGFLDSPPLIDHEDPDHVPEPAAS